MNGHRTSHKPDKKTFSCSHTSIFTNDTGEEMFEYLGEIKRTREKP